MVATSCAAGPAATPLQFGALGGLGLAQDKIAATSADFAATVQGLQEPGVNMAPLDPDQGHDLILVRSGGQVYVFTEPSVAPRARPSRTLRAACGGGLAAILDRRCARRMTVLRPGRRNAAQPNRETSPQTCATILQSLTHTTNPDRIDSIARRTWAQVNL
jgi:hypothetical protein